MIPPTDANLNSLSLEYPYQEIYQGTGNFGARNQLGKGSYGTVFRGVLRDGTGVAVKVLKAPKESGFREEVEVLSKFRHPNLVILMGFSRGPGRERLLIYELLECDVCSHMQDAGMRKGVPPFPFAQRLSVMLDAALGLSHLHNARPQVFHRDIKSQNILLDRNGGAKMADFGLALLAAIDGKGLKVEHTSGTIGYADPLYINSSVVTEKSEVYSFGMCMLELLTGKPPALQMPDGSIQYQFVKLIKKGLSYLPNELDVRGSWGNCPFAEDVGSLALACVASEERRRPNFVQVVGKLRNWVDAVRNLNGGRNSAGQADANSAALLQHQQQQEKQFMLEKEKMEDKWRRERERLEQQRIDEERRILQAKRELEERERRLRKSEGEQRRSEGEAALLSQKAKEQLERTNAEQRESLKQKEMELEVRLKQEREEVLRKKQELETQQQRFAAKQLQMVQDVQRLEEENRMEFMRESEAMRKEMMVRRRTEIEAELGERKRVMEKQMEDEMRRKREAMELAMKEEMAEQLNRVIAINEKRNSLNYQGNIIGQEESPVKAMNRLEGGSQHSSAEKKFHGGENEGGELRGLPPATKVIAPGILSVANEEELQAVNAVEKPINYANTVKTAQGASGSSAQPSMGFARNLGQGRMQHIGGKTSAGASPMPVQQLQGNSKNPFANGNYTQQNTSSTAATQGNTSSSFFHEQSPTVLSNPGDDQGAYFRHENVSNIEVNMFPRPSGPNAFVQSPGHMPPGSSKGDLRGYANASGVLFPKKKSEPQQNYEGEHTRLLEEHGRPRRPSFGGEGTSSLSSLASGTRVGANFEGEHAFASSHSPDFVGSEASRFYGSSASDFACGGTIASSSGPSVVTSGGLFAGSEALPSPRGVNRHYGESGVTFPQPQSPRHPVVTERRPSSPRFYQEKQGNYHAHLLSPRQQAQANVASGGAPAGGRTSAFHPAAASSSSPRSTVPFAALASPRRTVQSNPLYSPRLNVLHSPRIRQQYAANRVSREKTNPFDVSNVRRRETEAKFGEEIRRVVEMGFDYGDAAAAFRKCSTVRQAVETLLSANR